MRFGVLGDVALTIRGRDATPSAAKSRSVLALLVLRHNSVVRTAELIDELWGAQAPPSALSTLQTYIYKVRKVLAGQPDGDQVLSTHPDGYRLSVSEDQVDLCSFQSLAERGRVESAGDPRRASATLSEALALWRGPALANVTAGSLLAAHALRLTDSRLRVLELRLEADLRLGRHQHVLSELKALVSEHPLHEGLHGKLMLALHRCGRRFEALEVYRGLRRRLLAELGVPPGPRLRGLHDALLAADPALDVGSALDVGPAALPLRHGGVAAPGGVVVPEELPPVPPGFTGREDVLAEITGRLTGGRPRTAVRLVTLTGRPGIGKTATAAHAAHRLRECCPDGQLHVDLRGSTTAPLPAADALAALLRSCGVPADRVPDSAEERSGLFRTLTTGRRMLVLLDDAASATQVRPLLPGSPDCVVLITTRGHGPPGGHTVRLGPLAPVDGARLLCAGLGRPVGSDVVARIVAACDGLPLALRLAGGLLAEGPAPGVADRLADPRTCLSELGHGDHAVRRRLESGYQSLSPADRSAFRVLSLMRAPEFTAAEAARMLGRGADRVEQALTRLAERHLVTLAWRDGALRYSYPHLTRAFAREMLDEARSVRPDRSAAEPGA